MPLKCRQELPEGYGLVSRTETHYTFGGPEQPEGFAFAARPAEDRQPAAEDDALGLGEGDFSVLDGDLLVGLGASVLGDRSPVVPQPQGPPVVPAEEGVSPPTGARPKVTVSLATTVSRESEGTNAKTPLPRCHGRRTRRPSARSGGSWV